MPLNLYICVYIYSETVRDTHGLDSRFIRRVYVYSLFSQSILFFCFFFFFSLFFFFIFYFYTSTSSTYVFFSLFYFIFFIFSPVPVWRHSIGVQMKTLGGHLVETGKSGLWKAFLPSFHTHRLTLFTSIIANYSYIFHYFGCQRKDLLTGVQDNLLIPPSSLLASPSLLLPLPKKMDRIQRTVISDSSASLLVSQILSQTIIAKNKIKKTMMIIIKKLPGGFFFICFFIFFHFVAFRWFFFFFMYTGV